jgi:hypothetical protein
MPGNIAKVKGTATMYTTSCPECQREMAFHSDVPFTPYRGGREADSGRPVASKIYVCNEHGTYRCGIDGTLRRFVAPPAAYEPVTVG